MNDLYKRYGKVPRTSTSLPEPLNNAAYAMQAFNQFASGFKGNPEMMVQMLLKSGKMSQEQYHQLQSMANQFMSMMKK